MLQLASVKDGWGDSGTYGTWVFSGSFEILDNIHGSLDHTNQVSNMVPLWR